MQYYAPEGDIERGRRVSTKQVCFHCYSDSYLANNKDVETIKESRGQGYSPMCKDCLKNGVTVAYKRGEANQVQAANKKRKKKSIGREPRQSRKRVKYTAGF